MQLSKMKKAGAILVSAVLAMSMLAGCGSNVEETDDAANAGSTPVVEESAETEETATPTITEKNLETGSVTLYDYGTVKIHAYNTKDALGDVAYLIEGDDGIVGIELPSFKANLDEWQGYVDELGKDMSAIFVDNHPTGASYVEGMDVYGTQGAKDAIAGGSTKATADGLAETFGTDFDNDYAEITKVIPAGSLTISGIEFNIIDEGDTYSIEIPAANVIYTHMLGETTHSVMTSTEHMDVMLETLKGYQDKGYEYILSSHSMPETQQAVSTKIAYVEKAKEIAAESTTAEEFISTMKEAFPDYAGENYLEMSAGYIFAE